MKTMILSLMMTTALIAGHFSAHAQDRTSMAPHGGALVQAGKYYIEMVKSGDALEFYLLDAAKKPLANKGVTAKGTFLFADGTATEMTMEAIGDDHFQVVLFTASEFRVTVEIIVNKEVVSTRFDSGRRQPLLKEISTAPGDGHQH